MADYYTECSFMVVDLPEDAIVYALELADRMHETMGCDIDELVREDSIPDDEFTALVRTFDENLWIGGASITRDGDGLWITHDESINIDAVAQLLHEVLKKFDLDNIISFEYACTCSKPRTDAYGGGAAVVTKDEMLIEGSWSHVGRMIMEVEAKREKKDGNTSNN